MSYRLQVWEGPEPFNPENVAQIVDLLKLNPTGPNLKIVEFARRLMDRYPHDDDDVAGWGVWTEGEIDGWSDSPVYTLDVNAPLPSVLQFIAQTALVLGLNVHDAQTGRSYFSSGSVYPPYAAGEAPRQHHADNLTYPELKQRINEALYGFLERDGFFLDRQGTRLVRRIEGGTQGVHIAVRKRAVDWECSLGFYWRFDAIEAIRYSLFDREDPAVLAARTTDIVRLHDGNGEPAFAVASAQDASRAIVELQPLIFQQALPLLKERTSIAAFADAYLADGAAALDVAREDLATAVLIAARLGRHPQFGAVALRLAQAWKDLGDRTSTVLAPLLKVLRDVDPDAPVAPRMAHPCPFEPVELRTGDRVRHPTARAGTVRRVTGQAFGTRIEVWFDSGERAIFGIGEQVLLDRV